GGELLLRLAGKRNVDAVNIAAAEELSEMLGGLALAIDITARTIFVKKKSMQQFLPYFIKNKQPLRTPPRYAVRNPYYNETLATVWQTAFESLYEEPSQLLGLICFFAPDLLPRDIIQGVLILRLLMSRYDDAEAQLLHMSLIKINDDTGMISIHRLIQEAYLHYLNESQRQETCEIAYQIMCEAFPKRELRMQMYPVWNRCEKLIHHIAALQDRYEELR
ncbi:hypothetical protein DL98DRAFT_399751, partial [Cadophora sp. DSE1049]